LIAQPLLPSSDENTITGFIIGSGRIDPYGVAVSPSQKGRDNYPGISLSLGGDSAERIF